MRGRELQAGNYSPRPLVDKFEELDRQKIANAREMANLRPVPRLAPEVIQDRLGEWRRMLRQSTAQGRSVLQRVLRGRILFTRTEHGYRFEASTRFDKLFAGISFDRPSFIREGDRTGAEGIRPEDTPEFDYGVLLDRAYEKAGVLPTPPRVKGVTSPMPASWNQVASWLRQIDGVRGAA